MSRSMGARRRNSVPTKRFINISQKVVNRKTGKVKNQTQRVPHGKMVFVSQPLMWNNAMRMWTIPVDATGMKIPGETARAILAPDGGNRYISQRELDAHHAKTQQKD